MAKSFSTQLLTNKRGQTVVEYILLLAVISSLSYAFYNNKRFKNFLAGKDGMFFMMKKGISYSYRYGIEYNPEVPFESKMEYEYGSNGHDTYFNAKDNKSHFFSGADVYPPP